MRESVNCPFESLLRPFSLKPLTVNTNEELRQNLNNIYTMRALHHFAKNIHGKYFFNGQNELKLNENNYLQIILFFKRGKDKKCDRKIDKNREVCFSRSCCNRLYTAIINVKLAETNKNVFSRRLPKIKPIICTTRSTPEQRNFCRPTAFLLRVATVLKYFCLRDSFIIQIGVARKHLLEDNFFL